MKKKTELLDHIIDGELAGIQPLATRMRPQQMDDFLGQEHLLGDGKPLRKIIDKGMLVSMVFWGPPGTGKTSLARLIATRLDAHFEGYSAVTSQVSDIRRVVAESEHRLATGGSGRAGRRTLLFVDEFHRFNRSQQDAFLPHLESGLLTLIGATTENPYFALNPALRSRLSIFRFNALGDEVQKELIRKAAKELEKTSALKPKKLTKEAIEELVLLANGDARIAINTLEVSAMMLSASQRITPEIVRQAAGQRPLDYDRMGTDRFDMVSAFIKSMRGSDPDAALHWMVRLLEGGEAPEFIARRMVIFAAEDVGCAAPQAITVAAGVTRAVEFVGMPEAEIPLAFCCVYLSTCPKSNAAYKALGRAKDDLEGKALGPVPLHLRNYDFTKEKTDADRYRYPHDFPGHFVDQDYLPEVIRDAEYYFPTDLGSEARIRQRLEAWKKQKTKPTKTKKSTKKGGGSEEGMG